jgi:hypothetical protein
MSIIVLQHNPPPVIAHILRMLLRSLRPGGVAYFQVPTYRSGYTFDSHRYLTDDVTPGAFEMHLLPQSVVFQVVEQEGCAVLEVQPDHWVGRPEWLSNTFLVQRV